MHFTWGVWKSARRKILISSDMLDVFRTFQDTNEKATSRFWLYECVLQGEVWALGNCFISGDYLLSFLYYSVSRLAFL